METRFYCGTLGTEKSYVNFKTLGKNFFSPDGHFVISSGNNNTIRIYESETMKNFLREFKGHTGQIMDVGVSNDSRFLASTGMDRTVCIWELVWDYEFPKQMDWDEGAKPYLEIFLTLHCPYGPDGISRVGKPAWNDEDFKRLIKDLQYRGYGWLRPEGVRKKLEEMTIKWKGPPPLLGK